jgi:hypothetical protein
MAHTGGNPCRDPVTGRYTSCGTGSGGSGSSDALWGILGVTAGIAVIAGIGYAVAVGRQQNQLANPTVAPQNQDPPMYSPAIDSDNDGVPDSRDSCRYTHRGPAQAGEWRNNWNWGCPVPTVTAVTFGTDGGVNTVVPGRTDSQSRTDASVPVLPDTDNDNVPDATDLCPRENKGQLPEIVTDSDQFNWLRGCPVRRRQSTVSPSSR